jgi:hypothetical protein
MVCPYLVIVDNLNFMRVSIGPHETDSPLLIDPDAVLAPSVPSKQLQPIPGNCLQVRQSGCAINHLKFSHRHPLEARKPQYPLAVKERSRVL